MIKFETFLITVFFHDSIEQEFKIMIFNALIRETLFKIIKFVIIFFTSVERVTLYNLFVEFF